MPVIPSSTTNAEEKKKKQRAKDDITALAVNMNETLHEITSE